MRMLDAEDVAEVAEEGVLVRPEAPKFSIWQ
jgi:hypothetical protein